MKIRNPYRRFPHWLRGNTHTHSTQSDGEWPVEKVVAAYRDSGYDFLALTDHDVFTDLSPFTTSAFVALSSDEVTVRGRDHIVGLGLQEAVTSFMDHQRTIDAIEAQGGLAIIAHPNWSSLGLEQCLGLHGYPAIEILNVVCNYLEYNGYALQYWDELLRRGVRVWGIAADDAHRIPYQAGKAWIMVNAERLTRDAILQNIRTGNFYASTGPCFESLEAVGNTIRIACTPAVEVRFLTGPPSPAHRVRGEAVTQAEFTARPGDPYVRVEVVDAEMRSAWSQPFFIDPDWRP